LDAHRIEHISSGKTAQTTAATSSNSSPDDVKNAVRGGPRVPAAQTGPFAELLQVFHDPF